MLNSNSAALLDPSFLAAQEAFLSSSHAASHSHGLFFTTSPSQVTVPSNTEIQLSGCDKAAVGQFAASLRAARPPEPYKGKGVRYAGEKVVLRAGKRSK